MITPVTTSLLDSYLCIGEISRYDVEGVRVH
jgi:hypothetical protein